MNKIVPIVIFFSLLYIIDATPDLIFTQHSYDEDLGRAGVFVDNESYEEALKIYKKIEPALDNFGDVKKAQILNNMGFCAYKLKSLIEAESYYWRAILLNDKYVVCMNNLGALLMNKKRYAQALILLQRAADLDETNIKVIINLAVCYGHLKKRERAIHYISKAFIVDENYTRLRLKKHRFSEQEINKLKEYVGSKSGKK